MSTIENNKSYDHYFRFFVMTHVNSKIVYDKRGNSKFVPDRYLLSKQEFDSVESAESFISELPKQDMAELAEWQNSIVVSAYELATIYEINPNSLEYTDDHSYEYPKGQRINLNSYIKQVVKEALLNGAENFSVPVSKMLKALEQESKLNSNERLKKLFKQAYFEVRPQLTQEQRKLAVDLLDKELMDGMWVEKEKTLIYRYELCKMQTGMLLILHKFIEDGYIRSIILDVIRLRNEKNTLLYLYDSSENLSKYEKNIYSDAGITETENEKTEITSDEENK